MRGTVASSNLGNFISCTKHTGKQISRRVYAPKSCASYRFTRGVSSIAFLLDVQYIICGSGWGRFSITELVKLIPKAASSEEHPNVTFPLSEATGL